MYQDNEHTFEGPKCEIRIFVDHNFMAKYRLCFHLLKLYTSRTQEMVEPKPHFPSSFHLFISIFASKKLESSFYYY